MLLKKTLLLCLLMLTACTGSPSKVSGPIDVSDQFSLAVTDAATFQAEDIITGKSELNFQPINLPAQINPGTSTDLWLQATLRIIDGNHSGAVLELPGHFFQRVDIWFGNGVGNLMHQHSGSQYQYSERSVKFTGIAFLIPETNLSELPVLIRYQVGVPVNFSAQLWPAPAWEKYTFQQRGWYGIFFGAILILCIYNLFLAFSLKEKAYLYYVGYILSLATVVVLYSGLAEEFIWPEGKPRTYILMISGFGIFFGVGFVNTFLNIKKRFNRMFWISTTISILALLFGFFHAYQINILPYRFRAIFMHSLLVSGCLYFITIAFSSYFNGIKQARFLMLSMIPLLSGMLVYLLYTDGVIKYNLYLIHSLELGSLLEGIFLSLALSDRINLLMQAKNNAEKAALNYQRNFSRRLIKAQENDRERFSNILHDSIGHGMLVLKQNLEGLQRHAHFENPLIKSELKLNDQIQYCGEILADIRGMSHDLHPHILKRLGLKDALESTFERAFSSTQTDWQGAIDEVPAGVDDDIKLVIYRTTQECINNILKHSKASEVVFLLRCTDHQISVDIKDDGSGFDNSQGSTGLGLDEMRDRVTLFGGHFTIRSQAGEGTHVNFDVPIVTR